MQTVAEMSKLMTDFTVTAKYIGCPVQKICHQLVFSTDLRSSGRVQIISAIRRRSWSLVELLRGNASVSLCSSLWRILSIMSTTSTSCFPWTHTFRSWNNYDKFHHQHADRGFHLAQFYPVWCCFTYTASNWIEIWLWMTGVKGGGNVVITNTR